MSLYIGNKKIAGLVRGEDISHATEEHAGIVELATQEEVIQGSDDLKAVTSLKLNKKIEEIVGLLSDLQTENKTNIVNAINEINSKTGSNYTYPLLCINEEGQFADDSEEYSGWNEGLFKGMLEEIVYHEGEVLPKDVCGAYFIEGSLAKYFASDMIDFSIENMAAEVTTKVKLDTELYGSKAFQLNKIKATFTTDDDAQEVTITSLEVSHELIYVGGSQPSLSINNIDAYTPESDYNPATKKYVDDEIKELPMADLIHYQGHLNRVEELPSIGQPSGDSITPISNINNATNIVYDEDSTSIVNSFKASFGELYSHVIGARVDNKNYAFGTNYPEIVKGVYIQNATGNYPRPELYYYIDASTDKPACLKGQSSYIFAQLLDGTKYEITKDIEIIEQPFWLSIYTCYVPSTNAPKYAGNITHNIKYIIPDFNTLLSGLPGRSNTNQKYKTQTRNNYNYNAGMDILRFKEDTKTVEFITSDPSPLAKENNAYTVGNNYDLYVCDSRPRWNHWSKADLENYYNKQEVDAKFNDIELFKFPNATIIGEPTINNGQISDFTSQDYLQFPFIVDFKGRPFTINACFTTTEDVTTQQNIFDSLFGFAFAIQNSHFVLAMSSDGETWDIGAIVGTYEVLPNTTYYIKISWDGTRYSLSYSLDKQEYIDDIVEESELSLYPKQVIIGVGDLGKEVPKVFSGIINMNYCDLIISDKLVWSGMDSVGIASRADVSLSNLDEAGKQVIKDIAKEELPDMSDYYNKTETDNKIEDRISALPMADLIHYQGHLSSVEELPSTGQPSGDEVLPTSVLSQDDISHLCVSVDNKDNVRALQSYSGMPYVIGGRDSSDLIHGLASNYIDIFDKIYVQKYSDTLNVVAHVNASEDKPVKAFRNYYTGGISVYLDDGTKISVDAPSRTFTQPLWMVIGRYYSSSPKNVFYGNVTHSLKFDHPISNYLYYNGSGFSNSKLNTIALLSIDNYKYNVGMSFVKFNDLGNLELFTNEPSPLAVENNAYTVGDNYDIYVCDDKPRWNLWSGSKGGDSKMPKLVAHLDSDDRYYISKGDLIDGVSLYYATLEETQDLGMVYVVNPSDPTQLALTLDLSEVTMLNLEGDKFYQPSDDVIELNSYVMTRTDVAQGLSTSYNKYLSDYNDYADSSVPTNDNQIANKRYVDSKAGGTPKLQKRLDENGKPYILKEDLIEGTSLYVFVYIDEDGNEYNEGIAYVTDSTDQIAVTTPNLSNLYTYRYNNDDRYTEPEFGEGDIYLMLPEEVWVEWNTFYNEYLSSYNQYAQDSVPTSDSQIANKRYVDNAIRAAITETLEGEY